MKVQRVLLSGFAATSLMTLFSYIVSRSKQKNYKEPQLLAALLNDVLEERKELALPAGWATHYSMGLVWAFVHSFLIQEAKIKPSLKNGFFLGIFSGLTGILIWDLVFKIHPNPPKTDFKRFYSHLLLAHIVYSVSVTKAISESL